MSKPCSLSYVLGPMELKQGSARTEHLAKGINDLDDAHVTHSVAGLDGIRRLQPLSSKQTTLNPVAETRGIEFDCRTSSRSCLH